MSTTGGVSCLSFPCIRSKYPKYYDQTNTKSKDHLWSLKYAPFNMILKCTGDPRTNLIKSASLEYGYRWTIFSNDQVAWMQSKGIQFIIFKPTVINMKKMKLMLVSLTFMATNASLRARQFICRNYDKTKLRWNYLLIVINFQMGS